MTRIATNGYNELLSVSERVIDRLVRADFDSYAPDGITIERPQGNIHVRVATVFATFDVTRANRDVVLGFSVAEILSLDPAIPSAPVAADVALQIRLLRTDSGFVPLWVDLHLEDIDILTPLLTQAQRNTIAQQILFSLPLNSPSYLSIPLPDMPGELNSDRFDLKFTNDTTTSDRDSAEFAFYESNATGASAAGNPTRGRVLGIQSVLAPGSSFSFVMSQASFAQITQAELDAQWLKVSLTVGDVAVTSGSVTVSAPDTEGRVVVSSGGGAHGGLRGSVTNTSTGAPRVDFAATDAGVFSVAVAASVGDTLEIRPRYIRREQGGKRADVFLPTIELRQGHIRISGSVTAIDAIIGFDIDVDYSAEIRLRVDPVDGRLLSVVSGEGDLPWGWDVAIWILAGLFTGPFGIYSIYSGIDGRISRQIRELFDDSVPQPTEALAHAGRLAVFNESVEVTPEALRLHGQLEAGRIHRAGRARPGAGARGGLVNLEWDYHSTFFLLRNDGGVDVSAFSEAQIADMGTMDFEAMDVRALEGATYTAGPVARGVPLERRVFAIRTANGRFAKVRVDAIDSMGPIIRWVTYLPSPLPGISLVGTLTPFYDDNVPDTPMTVQRPATRYVASFRVDIDHRRLYREPGRNWHVAWSWDGPGRTTINYRWFQLRVGVSDFDLEAPRPIYELTEISLDDPLTDSTPSSAVWGGNLRVTVTDVFGRTATAGRRLSGRVGLIAEMPDNIFRFNLPDDFPGAGPPRPYF